MIIVAETAARRTLLLPALLDAHWPLLRWAFVSGSREVVVLEEAGGEAEAGLRYIHNDMCYPCVLIAGQALLALRSGKYDPRRTTLLIGQAGDACRGSCYVPLLRRALSQAGYPEVEVLGLNVRGLDPGGGLPITPPMLVRALAAAVWGDTLLLLRNQVRPYESVPGAAQAAWESWVKILSGDLRRGKNLSPYGLCRRCREMAASFRAVPTSKRAVRKVALVGELYMKYCSLGNRGLDAYLAKQNCEIGVNGLTWYALYYLDSHGTEGPLPLRLGCRAAAKLGAGIQRRMIRALSDAGFVSLPAFPELKRQAVSLSTCPLGDGWLITAEAAAWSRAGYRRILAVQPFGCLPNHVCGRGLYAALARSAPGVRIVSVDYDASISDLTAKTRIQMLLDDREL